VNQNNRKIVFAILGTLWIASIALIVTPEISGMTPVFPRPLPFHSLILMILIATLLAGYSFKIGINILRSK
jgi:hypothetical protein